MTIEPCPFCGYHDVEFGEPSPNRYAIDCPECEAMFTVLSEARKTQAEGLFADHYAEQECA